MAPSRDRKLTAWHHGLRTWALCLLCPFHPALPPFTCPCHSHLCVSWVTPVWPSAMPATGMWSSVRYSYGATLFPLTINRSTWNLSSGNGFIFEILDTNISLLSQVPLTVFHLPHSHRFSDFEVILPLTPAFPPIPTLSQSTRSLQLLCSLALNPGICKTLIGSLNIPLTRCPTVPPPRTN